MPLNHEFKPISRTPNVEIRRARELIILPIVTILKSRNMDSKVYESYQILKAGLLTHVHRP